jgi:NAD(P)H-flavin reductase
MNAFEARPYLIRSAKVRSVAEETRAVRTIAFSPENPIDFSCGQFLLLHVSGAGEAAFVPSFTGPDGRFECTVMRRGRVTEALHALKPGDGVGIRGPFGRPFPMESLEGRPVLVLAEGIGIAAARPFLLGFSAAPERFPGVRVVAGGRNREESVFPEALVETCSRMSVEIASGPRSEDTPPNRAWSIVDRIAAGVREPERTAALVFGPPFMLRSAAERLASEGVPPASIFLWMERKIACGAGHCRRCTVDGWHVCTRGPLASFAEAGSWKEAWT